MKSFTTSYFVTSVLKEFGKCYMGNFLRLDRPRDESCPSVKGCDNKINTRSTFRISTGYDLGV